MTTYTFLASSKEFQLSDEIVPDNDVRIFYEPNESFGVRALDDAEQSYTQILRPILTLPYMYIVSGVGDDGFFLYLDKTMEVGDVLEIVTIHSINHIENSVAKMMRDPQTITINVGSLTYKNAYGEFQLHPKNWIDDLRHRTIVSEYVVTTIVKY